MSTEAVYRATSGNLIKEFRRENFEISLVDYRRRMPLIGGRAPKFELLGSPAWEFSTT